MNYICKLNGKTITATNSVTGKPVIIAFAPFWVKPWSRTYQVLSAISTYREEYNPYMSSTERREVNEHELNAAGFRKPREKHSPEYQQYKMGAASYWKFKRIVRKAESFQRFFNDTGVTHVMLEDNEKTLKDNTITNVYELTSPYYLDENTDFGAPVLGTLKTVDGKYIFTPKTESDANSGL